MIQLRLGLVQLPSRSHWRAKFQADKVHPHVPSSFQCFRLTLTVDVFVQCLTFFYVPWMLSPCVTIEALLENQISNTEMISTRVGRRSYHCVGGEDSVTDLRHIDVEALAK